CGPPGQRERLGGGLLVVAAVGEAIRIAVAPLGEGLFGRGEELLGRHLGLGRPTAVDRERHGARRVRGPVRRGRVGLRIGDRGFGSALGGRGEVGGPGFGAEAGRFGGDRIRIFVFAFCAGCRGVFGGVESLSGRAVLGVFRARGGAPRRAFSFGRAVGRGFSAGRDVDERRSRSRTFVEQLDGRVVLGTRVFTGRVLVGAAARQSQDDRETQNAGADRQDERRARP